jgi:small-conductance mechanosensitive channel
MMEGDYNNAYATLSFLQQQNELLRLENQVLKVRTKADQEADEIYRERAELLRTMNKQTDDSAFDPLAQMEFEKFKDFMLSDMKPTQGWKERDQYHKLPYNVNAMQHFKQQGYDEQRTQWMKPENYTNEQWQRSSGAGSRNNWEEPTALIH